MEQAFIDGKNIYLRGITPEDVNKEYIGWLNDFEITKDISTGLFPLSHDDVVKYVKQIIQNKNEVMFAIICKKEQKHIGNIKLGDINWVHRRAYLGLLIGNKNYWGKGYATEACDLIVWYAFNRLNIHKLSVALSEDNVSALKVYKKLGFQIEGTRKQECYKEGKYFDAIDMGILQHEYLYKGKNMTAAIIQARMGSTRLPGKVMMKINDKPLIWYVIKRLKQSELIQKIFVATTTYQGDDKIEDFCNELEIECFRGSEDDVLDRYYQTAKKYNINNIIRITADCPLVDYRLVDDMIKFYLKGNYDYVSNCLKPHYPDGMDIEIFKYCALEKAWNNAKLLSEREHVTPYIWKNSSFNGKNIFVSENFGYNIDFSHFRLTVDTEEDFEIIKFIIENTELDSSWLDYISLLTKNINIMLKNTQYKRNEGYQKSLTNDIKKSQSANILMQERAKKRIPGMTQLLSKRPDQFSLGLWPCYYSKASGAEVWDLDGKKYIDMSISGIGANVLGYSDPDIDFAVKNAINKGTSCSLNCYEDVELAELLCEIHPWADKVRYARTGGESMAIAVRIARAYTGKDKVAFCGYHGWHDWYLSANLGTENALDEHLLPGLDPRGVPKYLKGTALPFRYNKLDELEAIVNQHKDDLAAIITEPIRNKHPESNFLEGIRFLANKSDAVLIVDEISAGFRMNSGGAHLILGFEPDIAVFSKAIGNGYPMAAVIGKAEVMNAAQNTFISSTYWTERIGPSAALATILKHRELNVGKHLTEIGKKIQEAWKNLAQRYGILIEIGGIPPLSHFTFKYDNHLSIKALFIQLMLKKGFLSSTSFYAMFAHKTEHLDSYIDAVDSSFSEIIDAIDKNDVNKRLIGKPAVAGFKRLN